MLRSMGEGLREQSLSLPVINRLAGLLSVMVGYNTPKRPGYDVLCCFRPDRGEIWMEYNIVEQGIDDRRA